MRKTVLFISLFVLVSGISLSCGKKSTGCIAVSPDSEKSQLVAFCTANSISYVQHSSGLLYQIIAQGTGVTPTISSKVYITYTGTLLNGTVFDAQSNATLTGWLLSSLIEGMRVGLTLIQKGGHIKLVIPSSMAYACDGIGTIPSNSPIYFDVTLVDVQ